MSYNLLRFPDNEEDLIENLIDHQCVLVDY